jgi:hypothetical protein
VVLLVLLAVLIGRAHVRITLRRERTDRMICRRLEIR